MHAKRLTPYPHTLFLFAAVLLSTIAAAVLPMKMSPYWNGEISAHRNQYEKITEAFLRGELYFELQPDEKLAELENPYDPNERALAGAEEYPEAAYYNGHYYMYFGVVPVFLIFLPYRIITGHALTTYHATQAFAALFICGIFALFNLLARRFFPKLSFAVYLLLSSAFSFMSIWAAIATPALYCTAQVSALMCVVWCLYFYVRAVWEEKDEKSQILLAFFGSLLGALSFGCRPNVALGVLSVFSMLYVYIKKKKKLTRALFLKLFIAALPFAVIGALLMLYNYARFGNVFEFGKSYQLTVIDASKPLVFDFLNELEGLRFYFFELPEKTETFPYITHGGTFVMFPILFIIIAACLKRVRDVLKSEKLRLFSLGLFLTAVLITAVNVFVSPTFYERYRLDYQYLFAILAFLIIGILAGTLSAKKKKYFEIFISVMAVFTFISCFILWVIPYDLNATAADPELLEKICAVFTFGI